MNNFKETYYIIVVNTPDGKYLRQHNPVYLPSDTTNDLRFVAKFTQPEEAFQVAKRVDGTVHPMTIQYNVQEALQ